MLGETVEHALAGERFALCFEVSGRSRRPRRHIIKTDVIAVAPRWLQQQLHRRHLSGVAGEIAAELGQRRTISVFEQRQQRLTDCASLGAHAAQQELLAFLVSGTEFEVEKDRDQDEDNR